MICFWWNQERTHVSNNIFLWRLKCQSWSVVENCHYFAPKHKKNHFKWKIASVLKFPSFCLFLLFFLIYERWSIHVFWQRRVSHWEQHAEPHHDVWWCCCTLPLLKSDPNRPLCSSLSFFLFSFWFSSPPPLPFNSFTFYLIKQSNLKQFLEAEEKKETSIFSSTHQLVTENDKIFKKQLKESKTK